jgi:hypothetical protein
LFALVPLHFLVAFEKALRVPLSRCREPSAMISFFERAAPFRYQINFLTYKTFLDI